VATLHIRNVPAGVYRALRTRARANGRSMNAEAIEILDGAVRAPRSWDEVMASVEERAQRIGFGADWPAPEDLIREDRDSR
jgi:plasmid stability protein